MRRVNARELKERERETEREREREMERFGWSTLRERKVKSTLFPFQILKRDLMTRLQNFFFSVGFYYYSCARQMLFRRLMIYMYNFPTKGEINTTRQLFFFLFFYHNLKRRLELSTAIFASNFFRRTNTPPTRLAPLPHPRRRRRQKRVK